MTEENTEVTEEQTDEAEDDLRGLLEEAFDGEDEGAGSTEAAGGGVSGTGAPEGEDQGSSPDQHDEVAGEVQEGAGEVVQGKPDPGGKAPIDWTPELREQWAGLPEGVRTKIAAREQQMAEAMQGTAQARQIAGQMGQIHQQYGSVMAAEGVKNPMEMVNNLMQTVSTLRMGSTEQKAQRVAELIKYYDIDVKTLDGHLAATIKGEPAPTSQNSQMEQMLDQRMAPVNQMMQQLAGMQQQKQQASNQDARAEVDRFASESEFLNDVRYDVADLLDLATRQGREMSLKEAYDKACAMHPEVSKVMEQRAEQTRLSDASQGIAAKRRAASSLGPGNPGGNATNSGGSLYEDLKAAWDDQLR